MQKENWGEADTHGGERRQSGFLVAVERGKGEHLGGKRVEVERTEQQRGRKLLHRSDEDEEGGSAKRWAKQWQMHPPQGFADRGAKSPRRGVGIARDLAQAGLDRTERRCEEAEGVGDHHGKCAP